MTDVAPFKEDFLGHYRFMKKIGSGGMGEVFLVEDTRLDRRAALKVLHSRVGQDEQRMRRFIQEAKTASALNHPNIITIYEIGRSGEVNFIVTEFIEGRTLHERINEGPMPAGEALDVSIQIATGLAAAHGAGIVHRDIKPENVMVRPDGLVKILDFGIAKLTEKSADNVEKSADNVDAEAATVVEAYSHPGIIMGTVSYMSPEQARGLPVDARSDIFSFGVLLFELLTGRQPFTGETLNHTVVSILENEPPPISRFISDYPSDVERIIRKCLVKDPRGRFQSAAELMAELKSLRKRLEYDDEFRTVRNDLTRAKTLERPVTARLGKEVRAQRPLNNLTVEFAPLIGRETEIAELSKLLRDPRTRIITLTGIGGTGKTRLARAVANTSLPAFPDGVFFVDLSSITNSDLVLATITARIGVEETPGRAFIDLLAENLCGKQVLLLIDNFEQVMPAAGVLSELIKLCPDLKTLVTSREVLNLTAEREFPVPSLPVPPKVSKEKKESATVESLRSYASVNLFEDRARRADPSFKITVENADCIAEICSRLDGLPLAIELAAARTKVLSPAALAEKLRSSLSLLTHGHRDLPARQQTMRGAIGWSYDLLNDAEKAFFRRLAVFPGSFTIDAADAVGEVNGNADEPTVDLVTSLLEKSLLETMPTTGDDRRFRMLDVVREFAGEMLKAAAAEHGARAAHAAYFLALSEEAEPHVQAAQSAEWLDILELEHDNLRSAMDWSLSNNVDTAVRLATATRNFWLLHSHLTEGFGWLKAVSDANIVTAVSRFKLLNALGLVARFLGEHQAARDAYEEAMKAAEKAGDLRAVAAANRSLGLLALHAENFTDAKVFFNKGLHLSREIGDQFGVAISLNFLGDVARTEGENATARRYFDEALVILRGLDNKVAVSDNLNNLAAAAFAEGDFAAARRYFAEALAMARDLGNKITISISLDGFAALAAEQGDHHRAARLAAAADQIRRSIGYEIEPAERRFRDAYFSPLKAKMDAAEFKAATTDGSDLKLPEAIEIALQ